MVATDKVKRTIYFHPVTWARLTRAAKHHSTSVSNIVRSAMEEWIDREFESDDSGLPERDTAKVCGHECAESYWITRPDGTHITVCRVPGH